MITKLTMFISSMETLEVITKWNIKYNRFDNLKENERPTEKSIQRNEWNSINLLPEVARYLMFGLSQNRRLEIITAFLNNKDNFKDVDEGIKFLFDNITLDEFPEPTKQKEIKHSSKKEIKNRKPALEMEDIFGR